MQITTVQDTRLLGWAQSRLGVEWNPAQCRWVAGLASGSVIFVVVYSRFSTRNCELTIATDGSRRWATKASLRAIFAYPFCQLKLKRVTFVVRSDNTASVDMLKRLGAVEEGHIRRCFDGDIDGIVFGMLREECRWA